MNDSLSQLSILYKNRPVIIKITICLILLLILYWSVFQGMVYDWINLPDFSHGFLIPLISLYLVWDRRDKFDGLSVNPNNVGLVVLTIGLCLLLIGNLASESFTMRGSFLVVLSGIILYLLGWAYLKLFLFPIIFLIFMIPIPSILLQKITFPLQLLVSNISEVVLQNIGIPILRQGNIIVLSNTTLEVAEACSGIRSLISLLALGTIFGYFSTKLFWQRLTIILFSIPIAILVNILRVVITAILASAYGGSVAEGFSHSIAGLMTFIVALVLLTVLGMALVKIRK